MQTRTVRRRSHNCQSCSVFLLCTVRVANGVLLRAATPITLQVSFVRSKKYRAVTTASEAVVGGNVRLNVRRHGRGRPAGRHSMTRARTRTCLSECVRLNQPPPEIVDGRTDGQMSNLDVIVDAMRWRLSLALSVTARPSLKFATCCSPPSLPRSSACITHAHSDRGKWQPS